MSVRSFAVFQDAPVDVPSKSPPTTSHDNSLDTLAVSLSSDCKAGAMDDAAPPPLAVEKENLHPVTGLPAVGILQPTKKRKMSVLATKLHMPTVLLEEKGKKPELKRRSSSTSTSLVTKPKSTGSSPKRVKDKQERKRKVLGQSTNVSHTSTSSIPPSRSSSRRTLAVVTEDASETVIMQAKIDSRCYELTVLPLADVSTAYLQTSQGSKEREPTPEIRNLKESSFEAQMRDYFSPSNSSSSMTSTTYSLSAPPAAETTVTHNPGFAVFRDSSTPPSPKRSSSEAELDEEEERIVASMLSTPERKSIYAAFTFSSPVGSPGR